MNPRLPNLFALALTLVAAACGGSNEGEQLPPPAAAIAAASDALTLEQKLERLDQQLGGVLETGLDENGRSSLYGIEALTDRLLEEEPLVEWLPSGYDVEARLRQIQALADRVIAEMRREVNSEYVLQDIAALQFSVRDLRTRMQQPGAGDAPPPLDSLLAATVESDVRSPAGASSSSSEDDEEEEETTTTQDDGPLLGTPVD